MAAGTSLRRLFIRTISAASIATSVPAPMAIPVSALVNAGASLIPSPTIATLPCDFRLRITLSFPSGNTPAITSSTPACAPIARAVFSLSPVSITTRIPILRSCAIAFGLSSFMVSATAIIPSSAPSLAKRSGVFPSSAKVSVCFKISFSTVICSLIYFTLPPSILRPSTVAASPFPGKASKFSASLYVICCVSISAIIARASGCSLFASSPAAKRKSSCSFTPSAGTISVTFGSPFVMVPVLSNATIWVLPAFSKATAFLNRIPFFAPLPLPTMIATGVASPSAQGQLITSTEIPLASANPTVCPAKSHTIIVITAIVITAGTKMPETLSAIFAIGALVAAASETIWIIWESVVSSPTRVARQRKKPDWLVVAALTVSPAALSTGILSPVRAASFTALFPSITTPSTGIFSPGRTTNMSSFCTCSIPTTVSTPSRSTVAVFGASFIRLFNASVVFPLECASNIFPTVIKVRIIAADSK